MLTHVETLDRPAVAGRGRLRSAALVGLLVAVVGLAATFALASAFVASARADVAAELERIAGEIGVQVNRRVEVAEASILTLTAQVSAGSGGLEELQRVMGETRVVEQVPGLLAIVHAAASKDEGELAVQPVAVHPLGPNNVIIGKNIMQEPVRAQAISVARDTGATTATSVVTHADGGVDAILLMVPVYEGPTGSILQRRNSFCGVTIGVVSPSLLFADVARLPVHAAVDDLGPVDILERDAAGSSHLWSTETEPSGDSVSTIVQVANRSWLLTVSPDENLVAETGSAMVIAIAGTLLSLLLGLLVGILLGGRERLEREVHERTAELQKTNDKLERASRLQSQFITTVSHELRTPLTSTIGFIQTVRRIGTSDPATVDDFLERAERNGQTLRRMIEELLDFGRLERGEITLNRRSTDVSQAVSDIVHDLEPTLGGRRVVLRLAQRVNAEVDRDALERIVTNLVANAVRYAPDAGPIEIVVSRINDEVEVLCCDRGPGFSEDDLPVLTERFVRGSGVMGEGTGIGLSIVRDLVMAHGGTVELSNRPGGGAEVRVTFPVVTDLTAPPAPPVVGVGARSGIG